MTPVSKTRKAVLAVVAAAGVTAGAAGLAAASVSPPAPSRPTTAFPQVRDQRPPEVAGSVTVPEGSEPDDEASEARQLAALARISPEEATRAATAAVPGRAGAAELGNENGSVVYELAVTRPDGTTVEVKVDAGNGTVLTREAEHHDESGERESGSGDATDEPESGELPGGGSGAGLS